MNKLVNLVVEKTGISKDDITTLTSAQTLQLLKDEGTATWEMQYEGINDLPELDISQLGPMTHLLCLTDTDTGETGYVTYTGDMITLREEWNVDRITGVQCTIELV